MHRFQRHGPDRRARTCADPASVAGRRLAYAGVDPILFPGSIRDNLVYGLRYRPLGQIEEDEREACAASREAQRTGNPVENIADQWIDYDAGRRKDEEELDRILIDLMKKVGMGTEIYLFGLAGRVDPERDPDLADRIVEARAPAARDLPVERHGRSRRAVRSGALQRSVDDRREPAVRRADLAMTSGAATSRRIRRFRERHRPGRTVRRSRATWACRSPRR